MQWNTIKKDCELPHFPLLLGERNSNASCPVEVPETITKFLTRIPWLNAN